MNEMMHPYAEHKDPSYENFKATCPICGALNIFNRATDLGDLGLISFRTVSCLNSKCGQKFNINGDLASPDYQMFIMQCYGLKESKQYMFCILVLAQAFELFFSSYLYKVLVLKPVKDIPDPQKWDDLNILESELYEKTEKLAYQKLRNIFLNLVTQGLSPMKPDDASSIIQMIPSMCSDPSNATVDAYQDNDIRSLLHSLKNSRIANLRNKVVHRQGYRPRLDEVEKALLETRHIIFGLDSCLRTRWQA
jgi:hypothetical protein